MYSLFVPMEWNMEGFIDRYMAYPCLHKPEEKSIRVLMMSMISNGAIDYWQAEVDSLKKRCRCFK